MSSTAGAGYGDPNSYAVKSVLSLGRKTLCRQTAADIEASPFP